MKQWLHRRRRASGRPVTCWEAMLVLQQYLDGTLADRDRELVVAHIEHCRHCGLEYETYEALLASLQRGDEVPTEISARLHEFAARLNADGHDPDEGAAHR